MKKTLIFQKMDTAIHKRMRKILFSLGALTLAAGFILLSLTLVAHYLWTILVLVVFAQVIDSMPDILYSEITVSQSLLITTLSTEKDKIKNLKYLCRSDIK